MDNPPSSGRELENLWRARVQTEFQRYRLARAFAESARMEFLRGSTASPEAYLIVHKCIQNERAALAEYLRILDIFNDMVMHGGMPPEDQAGLEQVEPEGQPQK